MSFAGTPDDARGGSSTARADKVAWFASFLAFCAFSYFRVRFVSGCDPSSYYLESLRFRGNGGLPAPQPFEAADSAVAPLCMEVMNGRIVSFFPPGYPLLLAVAGSLGLEFHVTALLGAATGACLYVLGRDRRDSRAGLIVLAGWLLSPTVFFGSTAVMSDIPATAFGVFSLFAMHRRRAIASGLLAGFSLGIRPTQLLFLPLIFGSSSSLRARVQFVIGTAMAVIAWIIFQRASVGAVKFPYAGNVHGLTGSAFGHQLAFLTVTMLRLHAPICLLAIVGLIRYPRQTWLFWLTTTLYIGFYAAWAAPFTDWWWSRYLLPALPALLLAAAEGMRDLSRRRPYYFTAWRRAVPVVFAGYGFWSVLASPAVAFHVTDMDRNTADDVSRVARSIPDNAVVGAINESAPLWIYGKINAFDWCDAQATSFVRRAFSRAQSVFAVLDPKEERRCFVGDASAFELRPVETLATTRILYRVMPISSALVDVGTPAARSFLEEGWSVDERDGARTFVWAVGHVATLRLPEDRAETGSVVSITVAGIAPKARRQHLTIEGGGDVLGSHDLSDGYEELNVNVAPGVSRLFFRFDEVTVPSAEGLGQDARPLAAAFDVLRFAPLP